MHYFPLCQTVTRLQASGGVIPEVYEVLVHIFYFKHGLFCIHMIFYISTYDLLPYFSPDDVRAHMHLRNIHLYPTYIIQGPYVQIHLSFG